MPDSEEQIEKLEAEFPALSGSAFAAARERALASGESILQTEGDAIYEINANGNRVLVKKIQPRIRVTPGRKIAIR